uniref:tRNA-binding domain-containing protein n=1 Tax=Felis catus TaxID=9685 RepID=A0ABI7Y2H4_FELCA
MATNGAVLKRLEQKGAEADQIIEYLKQQVALLKEKAILQATLREEKKLPVENAKLKIEIEELKQELVQAEIQNGVKQIPFPAGTLLQANSTVSEKVIQSIPIRTVSSGAKEQITGGRAEEKMKEKIEMKEKKEKKQSIAGSADSKPIDVSRLDLGVGCVITARKHPDADSLYVEEIDVGETAPRTVVSGLVNHVPLEQKEWWQLVMCASSPEKVDILAPPTGSVPGDRIVFDAFPGEPDKELNPKKKIWEQIQPDLFTSEVRTSIHEFGAIQFCL